MQFGVQRQESWMLNGNQSATGEYPHKYRTAKDALLIKFLKNRSTKRTTRILEFTINLCRCGYHLSKNNIGNYLRLQSEYLLLSSSPPSLLIEECLKWGVFTNFSRQHLKRKWKAFLLEADLTFLQKTVLTLLQAKVKQTIFTETDYYLNFHLPKNIAIPEYYY